MSTLRPTGVNRQTENSAEHPQRMENCCYEFLAFSRHSVDLEFDEEAMKPQGLAEALDNAGFPSSSRMSDAFTGTDWSHQARQPF